MIGSVAVLSDVHGVLPVLEAILAEPDVVAADRVVVTGDHAAGPMPAETLDALVGLGSERAPVRGNADRELVEIAPGRRVCASRSRSGRPALCGRTSSNGSPGCRIPSPSTWRVSVATAFCHGTPLTTTRSCWSTRRRNAGPQVLGGLAEAVRTVVCGHTARVVRPARRPPAGRQPGQRRDAVLGGSAVPGPCCTAGRWHCATPRSTPTPSARASWPSPTIRTAPPGPRSTSGPATATSTRCAHSLRGPATQGLSSQRTWVRTSAGQASSTSSPRRVCWKSPSRVGVARTARGLVRRSRQNAASAPAASPTFHSTGCSR